MAEDRVERRLAAILAADVAGHSRLREADEGDTLRALRKLVCAWFVALASVSAPIDAAAQEPAQMPRVGIVLPGVNFPVVKAYTDAFQQGMRDLGYIEGRNYILDPRYYGTDPRNGAPLAAELARSHVDVLVTGQPTIAGPAALAVDPDLPIVFPVGGNAVALGLAKSLGHPGGNYTGLGTFPELAAKHLELAREMLPSAKRIAILRNTSSSSHAQQIASLEAPAETLGFILKDFAVERAEEFPPAFATMRGWQADAVISLDDQMFLPNREAIGAAAAREKLPLVAGFPEMPREGCLLTYAVSFKDNFRRAADYVVRILKGAKPGDLPIQQPTRLELTLNLNTAKQLGITIPHSLLMRADEVIE